MHRFKTYISITLLAVSLGLIVLFKPIIVTSSSMQPFIQNGDLVFVKTFTDAISIGDIILFEHMQGGNVMKRVIAQAGDTVIYKDKTLYIKSLGSQFPVLIDKTQSAYAEHHQDGYPLHAFTQSVGGTQFTVLQADIVPSYEQRYFKQSGQVVGTWVVPENHYFVLGDNRDFSMDSRFIGFIHANTIIGKL